MGLVDTTWYTNFGDGSTTGHYAVAKRAASTAVAAGDIRRQFTTPTVGNERCFVCIIAGTTSASADATWTLTRGAKSTDGTVTWQECTGQAALNGDNTNVTTWAEVKAATPAVLGQIIKRSNNASYQICTTAGAMSASEPAFSDTAGTTTTDTTAVWTSLGPVSNFTTGGAAPFARLANACTTTWFAAGNTVYVADNHAELQTGAITIAPTTSVATTSTIVCHDHLGSYPPASDDLVTGATVSSVAGVTYNAGVGASYVYGLALQPGLGGGSANLTLTGSVSGSWVYFDSCFFYLAGTTSSNRIILAPTSTMEVMIFNNVTIRTTHVSQFITLQCCDLTWKNTGQILASGSSVPASLFEQIATGYKLNVVLEALDLSQLTGRLFYASASLHSASGTMLIKDCKLNAAATVVTPAASGFTVQFVRCDA